MKNLKTVGAVLAGMFVSVGAFAQATAPDVSGVVSSILLDLTPIAAIGVAVLSVKYGAKLWSWLSPRG